MSEQLGDSPQEATNPSIARFLTTSGPGDRLAAAGVKSFAADAAAQIEELLKTMEAGEASTELENISDFTDETLADYPEEELLGVIFRFAELEGYGLLVVHKAFFFSLLEKLFGAAGDASVIIPDREIGVLDRRILAAIAQRVAETLRIAVAAAFDAEPNERQPVECSLVPAFDAASMDHFELTIIARLDQYEGRLILALPRRLAERLASPAANDDAVEEAAHEGGGQEWRSALKSNLENTEMLLSAVLARTTLTMAEIAGLKIGQMLEIGATLNDEVTVIADERPLFRGHVQRRHGRYMLEINELIGEAV